MSDTHVLYRFYSATGQLLYVGITMRPPERFKSHRDTKEWWNLVSGITVENYDSRDELQKAERRAIQIEHPLHNVVHNSKSKRKLRIVEPPPEPSPSISEAEAADIFKPAPTFGLGSLFGERRRETRYGWVTEAEYQKRDAEEKAKWDAIRNCRLCDSTGYRNMYVCNHIDYHVERGRRRYLNAVSFQPSSGA